MGRLVQWIVVILGVLTVFGYMFLELAPIEMVRSFPRLPFSITEIGAHFLMSFGLSVATFIVVRQVKRYPLSSKDIFWTAIALLLFIIAGEITQSLLGMGRAFAWDDILSSTVGLLIATDLPFCFSFRSYF